MRKFARTQVQNHMIKHYTHTFFILPVALTLALCGCSEGKTDDPIPTPDPSYPTISVSRKSLSISAEGADGSVSIALLDAEGWTPGVSFSGCIFSATLSDDLSAVSYSVPANGDEVVKEGTVTITLSRDDEIVDESISFTQDAAVNGGGADDDADDDDGGVWTLVTDASTLKAGDRLVVACNTKGKVAGSIGSDPVLDPVSCSFSEDNSKIPQLPSGALVLTLGGSAGSWTLSNDGHKLGVTSVKKMAWDDGTTTWDITVSQKNSTIASTNASYGRLQYNASAPRFTTYTSGQNPVQLYSNGGSGEGGGDKPVEEDPYVNTGSTVSAISSSSATVSATFFSGASAPSKAFFVYGTDASYFYGEQLATTPAATSGTFSATISGLKASTKYYYKAIIVVAGNEYEGEVRSFTTNSESGSGSGSDYTTRGWFELPSINDTDRNGVDDDNANIYYAYHSFNYGGRSRRNYSVCFSGTHHCPLWIAAPRHSFYSQKGTSRSDAYRRDPDIPESVQYSSKDTGGGCNKGHMLGSAERLVSAECNRQVFYYSNIAPQLSAGFNTGGGGWNILEDYMDTMIPSDTLYEVIGCYFDEYTDGYGNTVSPKKIAFGGRSDVSFPTMFYYAVIRTKSGKTGKSLRDCSASELQCVAFVRSHTNDLKGQKPSSRELMSISDLEKITGFTYFVNIPNAPKDTFKASDWGL